MGKKVGVLLSGCGFLDGSEIHEAVLTLLYLDQRGAEIVCMAPDIPQAHVINHITQQEMKESRNVLVESARIARGAIKNINDVKADDIDAVILPGGFGSAKNLCDFAFKGPGGTVNPDVKRLLDEMSAKGKPIGALCIAPAVVGMALKENSPLVTIGSHDETIGALGAMGVKHCVCGVDEIAVDEKNRIVSAPAYMVGPGIKDIAKGIEKLVDKILSMI
ncbi:isoprenoid biosynthesis protein with amidotransferase-like domain [uncultured Desulfobacterium sp.]|uniref:Isoprenoid biosynthesis protein with amidotransferase-like domain n=1 Tax=uncultured Desulfobacterium sp. TaxID=201089 RepID=A0A445MXN9_9BACT|nr:isoprenoid biosynthesis protein with amidotransferase-like domain [uncultured Desulfobacterium sp.]